MSQNWDRCEAGLADSMLQLKDMKTRLNQSMPEFDDELQRAEKFTKVQTAGRTNQNTQYITPTEFIIQNIQWRCRDTLEAAVISLAELNLNPKWV